MSSEITRWRKKPVVIEAHRLGDGNGYGIADWVNGNGGDAKPYNTGASLAIATLEGTVHASPGDWVIKGVKGEFYPCKPAVFEATYEPAGETPEGRPADDGETYGETFWRAYVASLEADGEPVTVRRLSYFHPGDFRRRATEAGAQAVAARVRGEDGALLRERVTDADNARLRELLEEVGVLAANAPEDGDCFAVCEEIAMRIAAHGVPDEPQDGRHPDGCRCQFCREDEREERARDDRIEAAEEAEFMRDAASLDADFEEDL